jgi:mannan endo-1,4-beta-mannosidase
MNKFKTPLLTILLFLSCQILQAQKFEAESATLAGGAEKTTDSRASGGFYVAQKDGNLTIDLSLDQEGFYNIYINAAAPGGDKINNFSIDGMNVDFGFSLNTAFVSKKVVSSLKLKAGNHQVKITKSWGWINIDYIEFEKVDDWGRFDIQKTPVTPNPTDHTMKLYQFLYDNYGKKIISGAMTLHSMDEINWLKANTGKEPALVGIDFMQSGRGYTWYNDEEPINDARKYYNRNGIPALCWHWRDPLRKTEAFYTKDTNFDISKISDPNSAEYKAMINDIDYISGLLKKLQNDDIPVLWRPLHEASGGWFWWGAKGAAPCKALYRLMYDRMVNHHGLRNLIWVWTSQQNDQSWYPGDDVVDMIGRDIYKDGDHSSQILEFNQLNNDAQGKKMITLSECGSFPDADNLVKDGAAWSYYMPWYGDFVRSAKYNSLDLWKKMFAHDYVLTLDEMPNLKTYVSVTATWRSKLYPENWKPGFKDGDDRFLHDFSYAGYHQGEKEIPFIENNIVDVTLAPYNADNTGETDVTAIIQKALNDVGQRGGGVVYLPAGTYKVNPGSGETALRIQYSNTILRGAGADSTFIYNSNSYMRQKNIIWLMGDWCTWATENGKVLKLKSDLMYPTRAIPVQSVAGFANGDDIILRTDGTPAFIDEHDMAGIWTDWAARLMFLRKIDSINVEKNIIYIDSPTRYYMKTRDNARVYHAKEHITECGIENLSIGNQQNDKSGWDEETYTQAGTGAYEVHASQAILLKYAQNCWVKNVNTYKPASNSVDIHVLSNCLLIEQCRGVTVDSCFFQKSQYEGGGGNGYMFTLLSNDCLIKNSRANDSRHNYDFKFPYSNGNVIYNCIGENSKYSSDFHMYLSMANLIDNFTVDKDYLESSFRPYGGDVIHGYSSTQSVFYNTIGKAYHPNRDYIIESRQFKHGYVIGTSGPADQVKLDPVDGTMGGYAFKTTPRDFVEGIGKGDELFPKSLYLDQLERRLKDTTGLPNFNVTIKVIDFNTNQPVNESKVSVSDIQKLTDNSGSTTFENLNNILDVKIEKEFYESISTQQFSIFSDTTLTYYLVPDKYNVTITVSDKQTGDFFLGTRVTLNNEVQITNEKGETLFEVFPGEYDFLIEKSSYQNESGKLTIQSDSAFYFELIRNNGSIKFKLYEGTNTPVNNATVILNTDTLISTSLGISHFKNLGINTSYNYLIYKGGYDDLSGTFVLSGDTTVTLKMEPYPTSVTGNPVLNKIKIWPNPASETLNIEIPADFANGTIEILNLQGTLLKKFYPGQQPHYKMQVHDIPAGIYFLKINTAQNIINQSFVKE